MPSGEGAGTRRDILARALVETPSVSSLAAHYAMSFAAVQKHVAVLEVVDTQVLAAGVVLNSYRPA